MFNFAIKFKLAFLPIFLFASLSSSEEYYYDPRDISWVSEQIRIVEKLGKNGDIVFQYDKSQQSLLVAQIQQSKWTHVGILFKDRGNWFVYEAVGPVMKTPLKEFLQYTRERQFAIKRLPTKLVSASNIFNVDKLKLQFSKYQGLAYDLIFGWSDDLIYCSELVYKMYDKAFGIKIGKLQKVREFDQNNPALQLLIEQRKQLLPNDNYLDESIVTPISQFHDSKLQMIYDSTEKK